MLSDELFRVTRHFDPWRDLLRLQDDLNQLFDHAGRRETTSFPALNAWTSDEGAHVEAELPGISASELELSVHGDTVTLRGKRELPKEKEGVTLHRQERWHGAFLRTVQLPFRGDSDKAQATFKDGVLTVFVPRAKEDRPTRIAIKG